MSTYHRKFFIIPFLMLAHGLIACDEATPDPDAGQESEPTEWTPDELTLAGQPPIVLGESQSELDRVAPTRDPDFDGNDDPELQEFMRLANGVVRWQPVREGETSQAALQRFAAERPNPDESFSYVGMVTAKGHYLVEVEDEALMVIREQIEMIAEGGMAGDEQSAPLPDELEDDDDGFRGWSDGVDNRVRLTGSAIPARLGRVSAFGGQCSGALIGRRIVRTAAHCVIQHNSNGGMVASSVTFDYRRDAETIPVATSTSSFYYGGNYLPTGCATTGFTNGSFDYSFGYRNNFNACTWADWAFLILPTNWNNGVWHSWFGYKGLVNGNLGMELQGGGYPGCDLSGSPASCVDQAYYRDASSSCTVTAWTSGTSKFRSGCDTSPGNSGGPVWEEGTAYLIGHAQWQNCSTCSALDSAPNHYLGHDTWLFNFQNDLRDLYP